MPQFNSCSNTLYAYCLSLRSVYFASKKPACQIRSHSNTKFSDVQKENQAKDKLSIHRIKLHTER